MLAVISATETFGGMQWNGMFSVPLQHLAPEINHPKAQCDLPWNLHLTPWLDLAFLSRLPPRKGKIKRFSTKSVYVSTSVTNVIMKLRYSNRKVIRLKMPHFQHSSSKFLSPKNVKKKNLWRFAVFNLLCR